ncbi:hypothetical protein ACFRAO_34040 [Streptomyces sp. NPDC056656]|uniref:hypothetical protein n=1 Tax=Streptomyces sp. NPDC056656 TaxID=3345895 RepID=UPI0036A4F409
MLQPERIGSCTSDTSLACFDSLQAQLMSDSAARPGAPQAATRGLALAPRLGFDP